MTNYNACGVQSFTSRLALDIQHRLSDFAIYVLKMQKKYPEVPHVRSKNEWLQLYMEWSKGHYHED